MNTQWDPIIPASLLDWSHYISKEERNGSWIPREKHILVECWSSRLPGLKFSHQHIQDLLYSWTITEKVNPTRIISCSSRNWPPQKWSPVGDKACVITGTRSSHWVASVTKKLYSLKWRRGRRWFQWRSNWRSLKGRPWSRGREFCPCRNRNHCPSSH